MLRSETFYDRVIGQTLLAQNAKEREDHNPSGRLSAGSLGKPLQWQILHYLNVPGKEFDEYVLRKFTRGKDIESWFLFQVPNVVEQQKEVLYREVIGYVDAMVDTKDCDFNLGVIPCEIKSVTNMKYKHLSKQNTADRSHKLQAGLYALATGSEHFCVNYIASDDLRVLTYVFDTEDVKDEIDEIITRFDDQVAKQTVPLFEPVEKWQGKQDYNDYPKYASIVEEIPFDLIPKY